MAELNVGRDDGDRRRFGIELVGHIEERLRRDIRRILAGRRHAKVLVVIELGVVRESEQAHQHHVVLHGDRQRRGDDRRRVAAVDEIYLIDIEQLRVDRRHIGRIALIVIIDEFDRPPKQTAFGVLVFRPNLHGEQRRFAAARQRARLSHAEPDLDRIGGEGRRNRKRARKNRDGVAAKPAQHAFLLSHERPPFRSRPRQRTLSSRFRLVAVSMDVAMMAVAFGAQLVAEVSHLFE